MGYARRVAHHRRAQSAVPRPPLRRRAGRRRVLAYGLRSRACMEAGRCCGDVDRAGGARFRGRSGRGTPAREQPGPAQGASTRGLARPTGRAPRRHHRIRCSAPGARRLARTVKRRA